jgi:hypothetical protein
VEAGVEGGDVVAGVFCASCAFVAVMGELATAAFTSLEVRAASRPASATMLSSAEPLFEEPLFEELLFEEPLFEEPLFDGVISLDCSASSEVGVRIGWFEPLAVGTDDASAAGDAEAISVLPASARINHQPAPSDATAAAPSRMNCVPKR